MKTKPKSASTRPGLLGPENIMYSGGPMATQTRFNEAGAFRPGKPRNARLNALRGQGFNEAGAFRPGKPAMHRILAVMRCASTRPGLLGPENNAQHT